MKKKNVISLIKYYTEKNDTAFRNEAYEIAKDFEHSGDYQLSEYIMSLLSNVNTFVPQMSENASPFFERIEAKEEFSDPQDGMDYIRRLYYSICGEKPEDLKKLQIQNFTVREIEILVGKSKSSIARELKKGVNGE